ncbi:MAG: Lrp/AsnC family transcriptional regulator [Candidatus Nezhaarchaeales archaeon]
MDEKDLKILSLLARNSQLSLAKIGEQVGLSAEAVRRRIERMVKDGIIKRFTIEVDLKKLGYNIFVLYRLAINHISNERIEQFRNFVNNHPNILMHMLTSGNYDVALLWAFRNDEEYEKTILDFRTKFNDLIKGKNSSYVLKIYKNLYDALENMISSY